MGRPLDIDVVVAKHSSLTGQSVDVELPGLLKRTHVAQTGPEEMRRAQSVGMVVAEHTPTPGEGVLANLAGSYVGTDVDEDAEEGTGNP